MTALMYLIHISVTSPRRQWRARQYVEYSSPKKYLGRPGKGILVLLFASLFGPFGLVFGPLAPFFHLSSRFVSSRHFLTVVLFSYSSFLSLLIVS